MRAVAFCLVLLWRLSAAGAETGAPVLYAAASLGSALEEVVALDSLGVALSLGSSSSLAKQIERGAPADLFFAASVEWMDYLDSLGLLERDTRIDLVGNRLVVVAPRGEGFPVEPRRGFGFAAALHGRLAIGDPSHVPAGRYSRQALEWLGWWHDLEDRLVPAPDARAALAYVEQGACGGGIVYATDAAASTRVEVLAALPEESHSPIVYPLALLRGRRTPQAERLLRILCSEAAARLFGAHGFIVLGPTARVPRPPTP